MKIKDIFELARIEVWAENNDISDQVLLSILNENIAEFVSIYQTKKSDEIFAVKLEKDLQPEVYNYWTLEFEENSQIFKIRKILKVRLKWKNIERVDFLEIDTENKKKQESYAISWNEIFIFHNEKEIVEKWAEVIWLIELPEITDIETESKNIFLQKITPPNRLIKMWLKPFLYERLWNLNASINARQEYLKELKNYINRENSVKEPLERKVPDLSFYS